MHLLSRYRTVAHFKSSGNLYMYTVLESVGKKYLVVPRLGVHNTPTFHWQSYVFDLRVPTWDGSIMKREILTLWTTHALQVACRISLVLESLDPFSRRVSKMSMPLAQSQLQVEHKTLLIQVINTPICYLWLQWNSSRDLSVKIQVN